MLQPNLSDRILYIAALTFFTFIWNSSPAQDPGALDASFGSGGKVTFWVGGGSGWPNVGLSCPAAALQPDGKILQFGNGSEFGWSVLRYNKNGVLDASFGDAGHSIISMPANHYRGTPYAMEVLPSGKIILAGSIKSTGTDYQGALVRLNSDGSIDTTFGSSGFVLNINTRYYSDLALQNDGKIVSVGSSVNTQNSNSGFAIVRYTEDGALDNTFGFGGIRIIYFTSKAYNPKMCIQPDGKIFIVGYHTDFSLDPDATNLHDILLTRLQPDGTLDFSFGTSGRIVTSAGQRQDFSQVCLVQPDGKLLIMGWGFDAPFFMMQFLNNGTPDNTFGNGGIRITTDPANLILPYDATLQTDGKIVVCGTSNGFAVARFNPDGVLDQTFGNTGIVTEFWGRGEKILVQPDGKLVVSGETGSSFALARYLSGISVGLIDAPAALSVPLIYPNPVSGNKLSLEYELSAVAPVRIELLDLQGRILSTLLEATRSAGEQQETLRLPAGLNGGMYLINIRTAHGNAIVRITTQ
ncbi:MAG: T9SS type A sorting domain-containing protein [Bacteroidetes bacterium]|nr:MAG: T9SS type A sorting domain-containing protein [Bacteroidota bacterium]